MKKTDLAYFAGIRKDRPNVRLAYDWVVAAKQAVRFLKDIYPYLRLKKPQADIALQFQAQRPISKKERTDGEIAILEAQRILMKNLKRQ